MLNGKLALHDIRDTEAFTAKLIPPHITGHDREDIQTFLIETAWELSTTNPQPWHTSFSGWVTPRLRQRVTDWQRQRHGRTRWVFATHTHERQLPQLVSYEHEFHSTARSANAAPIGAHDHPSDRLARALPQTHRDPATDRSPDLTRLLRTPGSDEAWRTHQRRQRLSRRAA